MDIPPIYAASSGLYENVMAEIPSKEPTYMTVVALQAFSGLWKLNAELAAALKTTLDALQNASPIKVICMSLFSCLNLKIYM